jgi:Iron-containing redox enzyme
MTAFPPTRGPLSGHLRAALAAPPHDPGPWPESDEDPLDGDDFQLALYLCYELHYAGLDGVDERWEWSPDLIRLRTELEDAFAARLDEELWAVPEPGPGAVPERLLELVAADPGPPLSRYLETQASLAEFKEFAMHRSAYQLMEADPHSWQLPRLAGPPKAALVEIQADEYGGGTADRMHAELFRGTLEALGLPAARGACLPVLPGVTLATVNLVTHLGLHRRRRGACMGHLAVFEMTSSIPNRRYANGLRRLGLGQDATAFYDEHVMADSIHENIAAWDLAGGLARQQPELAEDIVTGGRALLLVESRWATRLLDAFQDGRSSLLEPLAEPAPT